MKVITKRKIFAYECDIYSHLNHSVYFNYFEEARSSFFDLTGISINKLTAHSFFVFVTNINSEFIMELPLEEEIYIHTTVLKHSPLKFLWQHKIYDSKNNLCNQTEIETVFIKNKKPIRLYEKMYKKIKEAIMKVKIAIPSESNQLCSHFGHCQQFAVYDINDNQIVEESFVNPPAHTPGSFPKFLHELGVDVVIAGGMGSKAQTLFKSQGIELVTGATDPDLKKLVNSYIDGSLESKNVECNHQH